MGYVWGRNQNPWGTDADGVVEHSSLFAKVEYLVFPWLIGSLKFDTFNADVANTLRQAGFTMGSVDQTRLLPGIVVLVRQNVRAVVEAELFTEDAVSNEALRRKPHSLWFRLDVAF